MSSTLATLTQPLGLAGDAWLSTVLLFVILAGYSNRSTLSVRWWIVVVGFAGYCGLHTVAAVRDPQFLAGRDIVFLQDALVGMLSAAVCGSVEGLQRVVVTLATVQSGMAIVRYFGGLDSFVSGNVVRASGTLPGPTSLAVTLAAALSMSIIMALSEERAVLRVALYSSAALMLIALVCTGYRDASLDVLLVLLLYTWRFDKGRISAVVAAILAVSVVTVFLHRMVGPENWLVSTRSVWGRFAVWKAAWLFVIQHPVLGAGVGKVHLEVLVSHGQAQRSYIYDQPLSLPLYFLDELGLVGLAFLFTMAESVRRLVGSRTTASTTALCAGWLAFLLLGITETPFGPPGPWFSAGNTLAAAMLGATLLISAAPSGTEFTANQIQTHTQQRAGEERCSVKHNEADT